jgi:hypothetical protein
VCGRDTDNKIFNLGFALPLSCKSVCVCVCVCVFVFVSVSSNLKVWNWLTLEIRAHTLLFAFMTLNFEVFANFSHKFAQK